MITIPLQGVTAPSGGTAFPQQQTNLVHATMDIRTNDAQQLVTRNVEQSSHGNAVGTATSGTAGGPGSTGTTGTGGNHQTSGTTETTQDSTTMAAAKSLLPPPPSRFQMAVSKAQKQVNQTRVAVEKYLLSASIHVSTKEMDSVASGANGDSPSTDTASLDTTA